MASVYQKEIKPGVTVDVYDVLKAFGVTCPATQHAVKKLLMPGARGAKDALQDLGEAKQAVERAIDLLVPERNKEIIQRKNLVLPCAGCTEICVSCQPGEERNSGGSC